MFLSSSAKVGMVTGTESFSLPCPEVPLAQVLPMTLFAIVRQLSIIVASV